MFKFGISPCPNDIFLFCGVLEKKIDLKNFKFQFYIEDVETLNSLCLKKVLDISKISTHAFFYLKEDYEIIPSGGVFSWYGPIAVVKDLERVRNLPALKIALPGRLTTAAALMWFYWRRNLKDKEYFIEFVPFYSIMDKVLKDEVDMGVVIHEGRFIYSQKGLKVFVDLGQFWINETGLPVPLGVVIAKKALKIKESLNEIVRESLKYSYQNRDFAINLARKYAQEMDEKVLEAHIEYYVNDFSFDMKRIGNEAIDKLLYMIEKEGAWE
ncbi:MAG: 1,4-dihydroxy-6-naphthoate synthase [Thermodesulfovibrionaceae bacterium]